MYATDLYICKIVFFLCLYTQIRHNTIYQNQLPGSRVDTNLFAFFIFLLKENIILQQNSLKVKNRNNDIF